MCCAFPCLVRSYNFPGALSDPVSLFTNSAALIDSTLAAFLAKKTSVHRKMNWRKFLDLLLMLTSHKSGHLSQDLRLHPTDHSVSQFGRESELISVIRTDQGNLDG